MSKIFKRRRRVAIFMTILFSFLSLLLTTSLPDSLATFFNEKPVQDIKNDNPDSALATLEQLEVKGRAPKGDYRRNQFSEGWGKKKGCSVRDIILKRDMTDVTLNQKCQVKSGTLKDPYTAEEIKFRRGNKTSNEVHIEHIVAVSDAWQKGAQQLTLERRSEFYNDPLNLLAIGAKVNLEKSDSDAASWLPPNKPYRCPYIARQILIKKKYSLWVTQPEKDAMKKVLASCPDQLLPKSQESLEIIAGKE